MRIVLVMSEASLWKPGYVAGVIERLGEEHPVVAAVLTSFRPRKASRRKHLRRYLTMLGPWAFVRLGAREAWHGLLDRIDRAVRLPKPHSIAGVCRRHDIPVLRTRNANDPRTIAWIRRMEPDVLLSSGNQIFGRELLAAASKACLNRHTSLLPSYGGIYPIFWCMLHGEREVGVSVHTMTEQIDRGVVLAQRSVPIGEGDTFFSLYARCFRLSVDATVEAVGKVARDDYSPVGGDREASYYSYPAADDVRAFRRKGLRMM